MEDTIAGQRLNISARALGLGERIRLDYPLEPLPGSLDDNRTHWWAKKCFDGDRDRLGRWLEAATGASLDAVEPLVDLDTPIDLAAVASPPDWVGEMSAILDSREWRDLQARPEKRRELSEALGLSAIFHPYIRWFKTRLDARLAEVAASGVDIDTSKIGNDLLTYLGDRLYKASVPSAALAINVARVRGNLPGKTPRERSVNFARQLLDAERRSEIVAAFPMLDRRLTHITMNMLSADLAFLDAIQADWAEVADTFGVSGTINAVTPGLGDPHQGGKTVARVDAGSGSVIFKPRDLAIDEAFHAFATGPLAEIGVHAAAPVVLNKGDHGWVEFIADEPCESEADIAAAFRKTGEILAVLRLFNASDIHFENVIFRGPDPVVIDLETLLTPYPKPCGDLTLEWGFYRARHSTLLGVGYLPQRSMSDDNLIDLSGAGSVEQQSSPVEVPVLVNMEGDAPSIQLQRTVMPETSNTPHTASKKYSALDFVDEIVAGFESAYRAIEAARDRLLAPDSKLQNFRETAVRWVPRATLIYAKALVNTYHPTALRDGGDLEMAVARMLPLRGESDFLEVLLPSELRDLMQGDVPYFKAMSDSLDLQDSRGQVIENFFESTAFDHVISNLEGFSCEDMEQASGHIRMTMAAAKISGSPQQPAPGILPTAQQSREMSRDFDPLEEADRIGHRLAKEAILADGAAYWVGVNEIGGAYYGADILASEMYNGSSGIGLFFAELGRATDNRDYLQLARQAHEVVRRTRWPRSASIGGFEGFGGYLYCEQRVGGILDAFDPDEARNRLEKMRTGAEYDTSLDIIAGSAGAILTALEAAKIDSLTDEAMETALTCGRHLVGTAIRDDESGARWICGTIGQALTGFSHGSTGIAYALLRLSVAAGEPEFADLAWDALRFDQTSFSEKDQLWSDLRVAGSTPMAWCHGSAGMTAARQKIQALGLQSTPDTMGGEVETGLAAIGKYSVGGSHCLCHGVFGNIDALRHAGHDHADVAQVLVEEAWREAQREGRWRCGIAEFEHTPGLMNGLSGIGLGLLRTADPSIPDVLFLET